jgi:hypothetical protein
MNIKMGGGLFGVSMARLPEFWHNMPELKSDVGLPWIVA